MLHLTITFFLLINLSILLFNLFFQISKIELFDCRSRRPLTWMSCHLIMLIFMLYFIFKALYLSSCNFWYFLLRFSLNKARKSFWGTPHCRLSKWLSFLRFERKKILFKLKIFSLSETSFISYCIILLIFYFHFTIPCIFWKRMPKIIINLRSTFS